MVCEVIYISKHLKGRFEEVGSRGKDDLNRAQYVWNIRPSAADFPVGSNYLDSWCTTPPAGRSHWIGSPKNWLVDRRAEEVNSMMGVTFK